MDWQTEGACRTKMSEMAQTAGKQSNLKNENNTSNDFEAVRHQEPPPSGRHGETGAGASLQRQVAKEFSRAIRRAQKAAASGKPELAVEWCRYAAALAWGINPGFFHSCELEQILAEIGGKYLGAGSGTSPAAGPPQRFLHVMSTAFERGGHNRAVARWIGTCAECAPSEHHSILITAQGDVPLPPWLDHSARKTGGELVRLPSGLQWLQAAAEIRSMSLDYDAVVLHVHPNDPLPDLAFYDQPRPTLFFNGSDHAFSLGTDAASVIAENRPVGLDISMRFRSPGTRKVLLPLPLLDDAFSRDKRGARKQIGLPADALIALTIGEPLKFIPWLDYSFPVLVQSLCASNPRLHIVAVGPSESEPFPDLVRQTGGRFKPVGFILDRKILDLYYSAADVYLDSFPGGSLTAALDAARHCLPVQRLFVPQQSVLWTDDTALDSVLPGTSSQDEFVAGVLEWLEWPEARRIELGSDFRNAVLRDHCGASWKMRWLDPAINAMTMPGEAPPALGRKGRPEECPPSFRLAASFTNRDWPSGMFVAGTIDSYYFAPLPIRISGVLHSIKPLLCHKPGDGTTRRRLSLFTWLLSSCIPDQVRTASRRILRAIFKRPRHRRESAG
jgi:hypothetical protein